MALKPCRECKKKVSTEAEACPNCGAPHPTYKTEKNGKTTNLFFKHILTDTYTIRVIS